MQTFKRPFLADEELGKKDDDHRPQPHADQLWHPKQWKPPRRRRILLAVLVLYLLYVFFKNMPTGIPPARTRLGLDLPQVHHQGETPNSLSIPQGPPPRDRLAADDKDEYYYEGKLQFLHLGRTLESFRTGGNSRSKATVFAVASLKSVSDLLPLACRMAAQRLNEVHLVLMGRDEISIEGIKQVNGIESESCPLNWHDARVDYAPWSTDARMERSVASVLPYLQTYLRPQVIITHGDALEESFFLRGIRGARDLSISHISLPRIARDLMWISTLTNNALRVWNNVHVEFLIYADSNSAGSLIRLIRSLENADFLGLNPGLTVELPHQVDPELLHFLKTLKWPSRTLSRVTVRRRVRTYPANPAEASLKAAEAFYPNDPDLWHVVVLSPNMELAPSFYHYVMYTMLRYKYSSRTGISSSNLMGISLELPSFRLTTSEPFKHPKIDPTRFTTRYDADSLPLFLWQAPNSNAALYFGDKWAELHSFLSHRLGAQEDGIDASSYEKMISRKYPAVMEYLLEFIRARGYYLLYPAFPSEGKFTLATYHHELFSFPEEFVQDMSNTPPAEVVEEIEPVERPPSRSLTLMSLLERFSLALPEISHLPKFSYRGEEMSDLVFARDTEDYLRKFRVRYGGCPDQPSDDANDGGKLTSSELFCVDN